MNLFAYPANFGFAQIFKCDYYGNKLSEERDCFIDKFSVKINEKGVDDTMLFGSLAQNNTFMLSNRQISIDATFLFNLDSSGLLSPATDLLMNLCTQAHQGTHTSYKLSLTNLTSTGCNYNESLIPISLGINNTVLTSFKFYLVSENTSTKLQINSINTTTQALTFNVVTLAQNTEYWIEVFQYGTVSATPETFPLNLEGVFRLDTSEGSFYNCLIDELRFNLGDEFVKIETTILATDFNRSTRFNFINTTSKNNKFQFARLLNKSRIKITDFVNDINPDPSTGVVFDVNPDVLKSSKYLDGLLTQTFSDTPFKDLSITISNNLKPVYGNDYKKIKRTYVKGFYSEFRKINGTLSTFALRSDQPTLEKFAYLASSATKSMTVTFGSQNFSIPYTVWSPGKIEANQDDFVSVSFEWVALAKSQQGQPQFEINNVNNF
jgi:hypothetical protein